MPMSMWPRSVETTDDIVDVIRNHRRYRGIRFVDNQVDDQQQATWQSHGTLAYSPTHSTEDSAIKSPFVGIPYEICVYCM